jgi:hypothetical protein
VDDDDSQESRREKRSKKKKQKMKQNGRLPAESVAFVGDMSPSLMW